MVFKGRCCFFCGDVLGEKGDAVHLVAASPDDLETQPLDAEDLDSVAGGWKSADELLEQHGLEAPNFADFAPVLSL